jgi:hypothetical protein
VHPIIRERATRYVNLCQRDRVAVAGDGPSKPVAPRRETSVQPALVGNGVSTNATTLWPIFDASPAIGLQHPMFAIFPLTTRPIGSSPSQQPIFAIGGIKSP